MSTFNFSPHSVVPSDVGPQSHDPPASPAVQQSMPVETSLLSDAALALFIDNLMRRFNLSAEQRDDLHGLYQLGTALQNPLGQADIMTRLYSLACQYGIEQCQLQCPSLNTAQSQGGASSGEMKGLMNELKVRLDDTFMITKDQRFHIRMISQELIYKPTRTSYKNLYLDVEKRMRSKPELYKMTNIYGQLARERKLASEARRIASNTRNIFRQEIRDSIIGKKRCSLQSFTADCIARYRPGACSSTAEQGHLIRNVILRRFGWENKSLLGKEEDNSEDEDSIDTSIDISDGPAMKRKRRTAPRGRVAHGEDFWARVDDWLAAKIELWGGDFSGVHWKVYIDESISLDNERHLPKTVPMQSAWSTEFPHPSSSSSLPPQSSLTPHEPAYPTTSPSPAWLASSFTNTSQIHHVADPAASSSFVMSFLQEIGHSQS